MSVTSTRPGKSESQDNLFSWCQGTAICVCNALGTLRHQRPNTVRWSEDIVDRTCCYSFPFLCYFKAPGERQWAQFSFKIQFTSDKVEPALKTTQGFSYPALLLPYSLWQVLAHSQNRPQSNINFSVLRSMEFWAVSMKSCLAPSIALHPNSKIYFLMCSLRENASTSSFYTSSSKSILSKAFLKPTNCNWYSEASCLRQWWEGTYPSELAATNSLNLVNLSQAFFKAV